MDLCIYMYILQALKDQCGDEFDSSEKSVVSFSDKPGKARLKYTPQPSPHWMLVQIGLQREVSKHAYTHTKDAKIAFYMYMYFLDV